MALFNGSSGHNFRLDGFHLHSFQTMPMVTPGSEKIFTKKWHSKLQKQHYDRYNSQRSHLYKLLYNWFHVFYYISFVTFLQLPWKHHFQNTNLSLKYPYGPLHGSSGHSYMNFRLDGFHLHSFQTMPMVTPGSEKIFTGRALWRHGLVITKL